MSIYAFYDIRYPTGVKVGRGNAKNYISDAQSWSPAAIKCAGVWSVTDPESEVEANLHRGIISEFGRLSLPTLLLPRNGVEWFDITVTAATKIIETRLITCGHKHQSEPPVQASDNRRDPLASNPNYKGRLVLWVMQECETKHVKLYQCSEWKSPREIRKRYSRQGFEPVAAFTYADKVSLENNQKLDRIRETVLAHFGTVENKAKYGWLGKAASAADVISYISAKRNPFLHQLDDFRSDAERPCGVRESYTGKGSKISAEEIERCFEEVWW